MLTELENERLTRVGPGTPMGALQRRFWVPVLGSCEVGAPGSRPVPVRILGEDLVCFRSSEGELGLVGAYCPHRRAPLQLARNCDGVLQCLYHGWKVRPDGSVAETPNEPEESGLAQRVRHTAYPVVDRGGIIWAYMGDAKVPPAFREFDWMSLPNESVAVVKGIVEANWLQLIEGFVDSSHGNFLHSDSIRPSYGEKTAYLEEDDVLLAQPTDTGSVRIRVEDTDYGFRYAAIRRPTVDPDRFQYIKTTPFIMPIFTSIPVGEGQGTINITAPLDDFTTAWYGVKYSFVGPIDEDLIRRQSGRVWDVDLDRNNRRISSAENSWRQDRAAMESGRSFSGMTGTFNEDAAMAEGMGRISDRTKEQLGAADRAVIHLRRLLLKSLEVCESGEVVRGEDVTDVSEVRAADGLVPIDSPWQEVVSLAHSR